MRCNFEIGPRWVRVAGLSLLLFVPGACTTPDASTSFKWQDYDPAVLEQARAEHRPVILDFHADWCPPCKELDELTFTDPRVIESAAPFVLMKIDMTDWESLDSVLLRKQFNVTGVPEILFLDPAGNEIPEIRVIGFLAPDYFLRRMQFALSSVKGGS